MQELRKKKFVENVEKIKKSNETLKKFGRASYEKLI